MGEPKKLLAEDHTKLDVGKFTSHLRSNALPPYGKGHDAAHMRAALAAGGMDTGGALRCAKDFGAFLIGKLMTPISKSCYSPKLGDIAVIAARPGAYPEGHIQAWDGTTWTSDFRQREFFPSQNPQLRAASYEIHRRKT